MVVVNHLKTGNNEQIMRETDDLRLEFFINFINKII